jgi:hypothetical protein
MTYTKEYTEEIRTEPKHKSDIYKMLDAAEAWYEQ